MKSFRSLLILICLLFAATPAPAAFQELLQQDFKPLEGVVVLPLQGEFLVDLDADQGLQQGDLLAVVDEGRPVIHPVTKEVLGRLDQVKAVLKVTRIKSGYSYAEPIGDASGVAAGDTVKRAESLRTLFWDYSGDGEAVYSEAKQAAPQLEWQGYTASQQSRPPELQLLETPLRDADLVFVLLDGKLQVRDARLHVLKAYNLPRSQAAAPTRSAAIPATVPTAAPVGEGPRGRAIDPESQVGIVRNLAGQSNQAVWKAVSYKQAPVAMDVADLDGDGLLETAVAFPERIEIGRQSAGGWQRLQVLEAATGTELLTADAADLDGDGRFELYLTATDIENRLASQVVGLVGDRYQLIAQGIDFYLRVIPFPEQGRVLLGQRMSRREDFAGPVFRVTGRPAQITAGDSVALPSGVNLYGFLPVQGEDGATVYLTLSEYDRLLVKTAAGETLFKDPGDFGGSMEYVMRDDPDIVANPLADKRKLYLQARMDVDEKGRVLVPANTGFTLSRQAKSYTKSQVFAFAWDGSLQEIWQTSPQKGYLADFRYVDFDNDGAMELIMALAPTGGLLSSRTGNLTVYEF